MSKPARFRAKLWRYSGPAGWFFVTVPKKYAPPVTAHFGRTPVRARVDGGPEWSTSTWRDTERGTLLAVPKRFRGDKKAGDIITIELSIRDG